jgi:hypothetical protein
MDAVLLGGLTISDRFRLKKSLRREEGQAAWQGQAQPEPPPPPAFFMSSLPSESAHSAAPQLIWVSDT